jgi:hypothetical protein
MAENQNTMMFPTSDSMLAAFGPFASICSRMVKDTVQIQTEMLSFVQKRLDQDIESSTKFWSSHTPSEAAEVMNDFYQRAARDYQAEAQVLMNAMQSFVQGTLSEQEQVTDKFQAKPQ